MTFTTGRFSSTERLSLKPRKDTDTPYIIAKTYACLPAQYVSTPVSISSSQPLFSSIIETVGIIIIVILAT